MKNSIERASENEFDAFVVALHDTAGPPADDPLLSRIVQSRHEGVRVLLPPGDMPIAAPVRRDPRWIWVAAAAAALVGVPTTWSARSSLQSALVGRRVRDNRSSSVTAARGNDSGAVSTSSLARKSAAAGSADGLSQLLMPWPQVAYAQSPGVKREAPYSPVTGANTERLTEGRRTYLRSSASDYHTMLPHEIVTVETARTRLRGVQALRIVLSSPAWRPGQRSANDHSGAADTLWLRARDLRPIERRYRLGEVALVIQRFSDSALVETDSMLPRRGAITRALHHTTLLDTARVFVHTEATMRALLRSLPLSTGWRGSVSVPGGESRVMVIGAPQYLNLRVTGVDTVQTYGGRFACWRVVLDTGIKPDIWYVSQETGETILTDGAYGPGYPQSQLRLLYGFEETKRIPPVRVH